MTNKHNHFLKCSCINCKIEIDNANLSVHYHKCTQHLFPKLIKEYSHICEECGNNYTSKSKTSRFCSHTCTGSYSNRIRKETGYTQTQELNSKISKGMINHHIKNNTHKKPKEIKPSKPISIKQEVVGEFTKIFECTCKICKTKFFYKSSKQYCIDCHTESSNKRSRYKFSFNLYNYPNLFNLDLLNEIGFYGSGGKSSRYNLQGLSRDHKVSVSEAIENNYEPFYITHPLNCELMLHADNSKKKCKSSITYEHLKHIVDDYEINRSKSI